MLGTEAELLGLRWPIWRSAGLGWTGLSCAAPPALDGDEAEDVEPGLAAADVDEAGRSEDRPLQGACGPVLGGGADED